ncbi:dTDP-4-dehydrorhamnose 3,5-epimerase [Hirschia baltica]|uniref:dTDP-4-dehydrorhamnose 3,5-epimerase n=1 Tax=Hirschia baltica (strain ATCC 49814 / DSM 5838 / IFAM 1418) TaxID=582402 RepID=C6XRY4_HIRBI|nr:dTDP-4-dehydrorhamnose 3,5-epimerase [Hirschia baltica]ACT60825.1 dTDP-4-dehydrorhamnose 3,5-epimerase [Hirschia baltica ATCC 49814]
MEVRDLGLDGVKEITPARFGDARGFFSETYSEQRFSDAGLPTGWVQDNHSLSAEAFVLRGLHFQTDPFAQDKLVRVLKGEIFDVAVDIRKNSPDYGKWVGITLTAEKGNQILVPKGFAHGFLTLTPNVEVAYKVTSGYAPENDRGIIWNDPAIGIDWPLNGHEPQLSGKDAVAPLLADVDNNFEYKQG